MQAEHTQKVRNMMKKQREYEQICNTQIYTDVFITTTTRNKNQKTKRIAKKYTIKVSTTTTTTAKGREKLIKQDHYESLLL